MCHLKTACNHNKHLFPFFLIHEKESWIIRAAEFFAKLEMDFYIIVIHFSSSLEVNHIQSFNLKNTERGLSLKDT